MNKIRTQKVIQLVGIRQHDKQLFLTQEGKQFLQQINAPISVITIAGLYRTGKSYLVNQLISKLNQNNYHQSSKFIVGNTVQSCTKGLNVWAIPFQASISSPKFYYIVIDSQGIGSMEQEQNYDVNLLMLIFLISSTVIYNSIGAIDEQSLDQLRVIVNLKKSFQTQSNTQPKFIWVLRDFALQLINKNQQIMTSNQYLQDCLQLMISSNKQVVKKNQIRQAIKKCLPNRSCHTLVRPTIKQEDLSNLHSLPKSKLRKQFIEQLNGLFSQIFTNQSDDIKYLNEQNNYVDGGGLSKMIEYYLSQINCNKVPEIKSVWELIQSTKLDQMIEQCENDLKTQTLKIDLPLSEEQLKLRLNQIQNKIFIHYQNQLSPTNIKTYKKFSEYFIKLTNKINNKIRKANQDIKKKKSFKQIRDKINSRILFDKIDPCSMVQVRDIVQSLQLKNRADSQIYEYVMGTILDVIEIAQQKTIKLKNELSEYEQNEVKKDYQQTNKEQEIIRLKQNYSQALKQISYLKNNHIQTQKDLAITRQQLQILQKRLMNISVQKQQKQQQLKRRIQQQNEKIRRRNEQNNETMKYLRQQNNLLISELQQVKKQYTNIRYEQRKQLIFEQKIKQSWDKFEQQRIYFKKQLDRFKSLYNQSQDKYRLLYQKYFYLEQNITKQRQLFNNKQKQFCDQLLWMKQNYSKTKLAYNQSLNTRIQNQKILQDITQTSKKRNSLLNNQNIIKSNISSNIVKSNVSSKIQIQQITNQNNKLKSQKQNLQKEVSKLNTKLQKQQIQFKQIKQFYQQKLDTLQEHSKMLQQGNQAQKQRFYSCLKQLQQSKASQRQMYQDSIMKLLDNMEKYQPTKGKSKTLERGLSSSNIQKNKKYLY